MPTYLKPSPGIRFRIAQFKASRNYVEVGPYDSQRNTWPQSTVVREPARAPFSEPAIRRIASHHLAHHHHGQPNGCGLAKLDALKRRSSHSNHGERTPIQNEFAAHDPRITAEFVAPVRLAHHTHGMPTGNEIVLRTKQP